MKLDDALSKLENATIYKFFSYQHLPPFLQEVSRNFEDLARFIIIFLPDCEERSVALRKLLEAKDAAVRSRLNA